ncbi:MAG: MATE family efflux transporter [Oscillospiraceae bacterium]|nr:MATE family efflux transporter [Oscillospiraceae bacterium]
MIQLSDHFDCGRLLRFTFPSIIMLVFTSIYGVVDGFFVSNFAGKIPFAAVNFIMPVLMILGCAGFMFGTGGSALIGRTLGQGKREKANEIFSLLVYAAAASGAVLAVAGMALLRPLAALLGAQGQLLEDSVLYGRIILLALPCFILQMAFQCLFVTAEKPKLGLAVTVAGMLYNLQLMRAAGEDGVAAYGVLMYVSLIFQGIFIGYSVGAAPVVSYHFGAGNRTELKGLLRRSAALTVLFSAAMCLAGETLGRPLSLLFVGYDPALMDMTVHAFSIFSISFLFSGLAVFGSSFFTALNDGLTSALISFLRTLVFQCAAVLVFPLIWQLDGIWWSIVAAEVMAVAVTALFLAVNRGKYGY